MSKTTDALIQLISTRSKTVQTVRALLGDGTGTVAVSGTENYAWARPYGRDMPVRAYGPAYRVAPHDLPVRLEIVALGARVIYKIAGVDDMMYLGTTILDGWGTGVPAHAVQHQISNYGFDPVYLDTTQLIPLLIYATDPASTSIYIAAGTWWGGTALQHWEGGNSADLSTYDPGAGVACYILIYFDDSAELGYLVSDAFADIPSLYPSPYDVNMPLPPNSVPLGMVLLQGGASSVAADKVYSFRNIISMISSTSIISDTLMIAAQVDGLFSSTGGAWTAIAAGSVYLESIDHILLITTTTWLVFRTQTAAASTNPIVYKTENSGGTWAKAQTGISFTQGSDLWKVCAVWQSPTNASNIAIVIANTTTDTTPQVFVTSNAGVAWSEVVNTGLPTTNLATDIWPVSLGVNDSGVATFHACIAMQADSLYYMNLPATWVKKTPVPEDATAVINDRAGTMKWWMAAQTQLVWTDDNWATSSSFIFADDRPSGLTHTIFQHLVATAQLVVGGFVGTYYTDDAGATFNQYDAHKLGTVGPVLASCIGDPSKLLVADSAGALYLSLDAGVSTYQRLALSSVVAAAAITLTADAPGTDVEFSTLELWLKV